MPDSQGGDSDRIVRPEPTRTGPRRRVSDFAPECPDPDMPPTYTGPSNDAEIGRIVGDAVRVGYDVINDNLRQGRAAADRYSAGQYRLADVPEDMSHVGRRLMALSRELSTTWFDLVGAVLRDPNIRNAVQQHARPIPHEPDPDPRTGEPGPVAITCRFRGTRRASADATTLTSSGTRLVPTMTALNSDAGHPPITQISFIAAKEGDIARIVAVITIRDDQPAGTYHGAVTDAATSAVLGAIIVKLEP